VSVTADAGPTRHLGIDVGVTNLKWAIVERLGDQWQTIDSGQLPTQSTGGPSTVVPQVAQVAKRLADEGGPIRSIGIGIPGLYEPDLGTTLFFVNMPGDWKGVALAGPVADATGLPTALINDARAFGHAELRMGAGRGCRTMVGLTLGTGVGGVIAIDGRVHLGYKGTAGEIGHQVIDPDGPWCGCGTRGCVEAYARADQIARMCDADTVEEAVARARAGDARATAGLAEVGRYLGIGIANLIVLLTPERVVIGGGVAAAGELILAPIRDEIARRVHVTSHGVVELVTAELGTFAGAIGAAVYGAERAATLAGVAR
jgi:glucokinase